MAERSKYRIRTYSRQKAQNIPIYLEEKSRILERTFKRRYEIGYKNLGLFYNNSNIVDLPDVYPNVPLIKDFIFHIIRKSVTPCIVVDYMRTPYVSDYDVNFRLTFDRSLAVSMIEKNPSIFYNERPWININSGYNILEVKFYRRIPPWFHRIIQSYELTRLSISKFAKGMEACYVVTDTGI